MPSAKPAKLSKRLFVVMAIFIALFCYYTFSPTSHFRQPSAAQNSVSENTLVLGAPSSPLRAAHLVGNESVSIYLEGLDENLAQGQHVQVQGVYRWGNGRVVLTLSNTDRPE